MARRETGRFVSDMTAAKTYRVTQSQLDRIEAVWKLCSWPSGRRITDQEWCALFEQSVYLVLGEYPLWPFTVEIV